VQATKPREIAVNILLQHQQEKIFVDDLLVSALGRANLKLVDRHLIQEIVMGVVRWQSTLDWLIQRKTQDRPQHPVMQTLLRLGLYQMFWLDRIPDYASVNDTVQICRQLGFARQSGFINAVLRGYGRDRPATRQLLEQLKTDQPFLGFSHPQWLADRWSQQWDPETACQIMSWNNGPASIYARLNSLRASTPQVIDAWASEGVKFLPRQWDWTGSNLMFELLQHPPIDELESFQKGWFYIQDPSTVLAVHLLNPQPNDTILDACAAPGGKTTLIAQFLQNQGRIQAEDVVPDRVSRLGENCRRLSAVCVNCAVVEEYGPAPIPQGSTLFDRVLVDVPCSNTGVLRRRVDARWRLQPDNFARFTHQQSDLLKKSAARVRPGGIVVYSTCSLEPEENHDLVRQFLDAHPHFVLDQERQLRPDRDAVDGAYVARLRFAHEKHTQEKIDK
jgi:16S rRNA (cytosine967-C5)-methyltransferase